MQKKIFFIILVILIFISGCDKLKQKEKEKEVPKITYYFKFWDELEKKYTTASYQLEANKQVIKKGTFETPYLNDNPTLLEIKDIPLDNFYIIYFWNDDYYTAKTILNKESYQTLTFQKERKKGKPEVNFIDEIDKGKLYLNVSSNYSIQSLSFCIKKSIGFLYVQPEKLIRRCEQGKWLNYSQYFPENDSYVSYPENVYRCGDVENIEYCTETFGNECFLPSKISIPERHKGTDYCFYTGEVISNSNYLLELNVKTIPQIDEKDYIEVCLMDGERSKTTEEECSRKDYEYMCWLAKHTSIEGKDLGIKDQCWTFQYEYSELLS